VARGVALCTSFGSVVAQVVEVSLAPDQQPRVHRVVAVVDCGIAVNPGLIRQQIEGSVIFGLSAALHGKVSFDVGVVREGNFDAYRVLRLAESPQIEVHIMPSEAAPTGLGEPGVPPIAPAVANALCALTGIRRRRLPLVQT
jgi:isoquinoline 1-oxidoreductase beta subunit